ncbi:MAG: glycoside hydrolase family 3 protein [Proteobacteria bacterium]|nr:glycoside hydrolase family 3 protein [Pseudomonadota bacterium]
MIRVSLRLFAMGAAAIGALAGTFVHAGDAAAVWPQLPAPRPDPAIEARIDTIIAGMTLEQKIGQMTQAEIKTATPDQVRQFYLGSVLNGGGSWPGLNKDASAADWAGLAERYYQASLHSDMKVPVPVIWGIDAVHGNNNALGATLFPHNIGLGAAHDPALVRDVAHATARAVRATGISWAFAPTVAVAQNPRWGRFYESYSSDPALVRSYGEAAVRGLQGNLSGPEAVVASVKHYIGDGGTYQGVDEGDNRASEAVLAGVHAQGYYGALAAGVQTVMASYNSWSPPGRDPEGRLHGSGYLLTTVLKQRLGFDGLVISDWNAIRQVPGCTIAHCPQAINAGVDMVMVPDDWQAFITNTLADVREGRIPMARIDDAVRRILRVKLRSGLFAHSPASGGVAGSDAALADRALARRAVRESLVLLKNQNHALPLKAGARVLVVGDAADSMARQAGGWSRTWQGTENRAADYRPAETLLAALRNRLGTDRVTYSVDGKGVNPRDFDAVVAVLGEAPYAEYSGDIPWPQPLTHTLRTPRDGAALAMVAGKGVPVVTVFYSGRPLPVNDLLNRSSAFVAAWLPGSEGGGVADVLLGQGTDFRGRLPFAWPADACATRQLFARGYGLSYARPGIVARLPEPPPPASCEARGH